MMLTYVKTDYGLDLTRLRSRIGRRKIGTVEFRFGDRCEDRSKVLHFFLFPLDTERRSAPIRSTPFFSFPCGIISVLVY